MLTLQKTAPEEGVELLEREPPEAPGPGEVLVDVAAVGLCGSDSTPLPGLRAMPSCRICCP